jgi:uncharacterized DUF497 family protein
MQFEWDDTKNKANLEKHGIAFEDAQRIFEGTTLQTEDGRQDYGKTCCCALDSVKGNG